MVYPNCELAHRVDRMDEVNANTVEVRIIWGVSATKAVRYHESDTDMEARESKGDDVPQVDIKWDTSFDLGDPGAMMHILEVCQNLRRNMTELVQGISLDCFMEQFASDSGAAFPFDSSEAGFSALRKWYLRRSSELIDKRALIFSDDLQQEAKRADSRTASRVMLASVSFYTTISASTRAFTLLSSYEDLDSLIKRYNSEAPATANGAYQTSDSWSLMFTEITAISSTGASIILMVVTASLAVYAFTSSVRVSLIMMLIVAGAVIIIIGSFPLAGWKFGIVQAISISILLGSAVDYPLHVAESYVEGGEIIAAAAAISPGALAGSEALSKYGKRVGLALERVGWPVLNAALTTVGAMFMLLFCEVKMLADIGELLLISAVVSVCATMTALVAFLALCGPNKFVRTQFTSLVALGVCALVITVGLICLFVFWDSIKLLLGYE